MRCFSASRNRSFDAPYQLAMRPRADRLPSEFDPQPTESDKHVPPGIDDDRWDIFLPDEDELDPLPGPDDFWIEPDQCQETARAA